MTTIETQQRVESALRACADDLLRYFVGRLDREDAADAVAEVMRAAWSRANALPANPQEARMWLFGIAGHVLAHARRGTLRHSRLGSRLRAELSTTSAPPADSGIEVRDAIARLDDDLAEIVRLVHWDGFSLAETAMIVGIPSSTARGRYQRAKQQLREALAPLAMTGGALP